MSLIDAARQMTAARAAERDSSAPAEQETSVTVTDPMTETETARRRAHELLARYHKGALALPAEEAFEGVDMDLFDTLRTLAKLHLPDGHLDGGSGGGAVSSAGNLTAEIAGGPRYAYELLTDTAWTQVDGRRVAWRHGERVTTDHLPHFVSEWLGPQLMDAYEDGVKDGYRRALKTAMKVLNLSAEQVAEIAAAELVELLPLDPRTLDPAPNPLF